MRQRVAIFTTASLPWMTGTAVNPLFRAAYLAGDGHGDREVTLVIPWLSRSEQVLVYPNGVTFSSPSEQESFVRRWIEERVNFRPEFQIKFYPAKFSKELRSIIQVGDLTECIPDEEADVAILEEPEHLNWYHHGRKWKHKFRRVIGIVHTNYLEYVRREKNGRIIAFVLRYMNSWVTRIYCHKIIRLSAATQDLPRSIVCNVHGVNPKFLEIGRAKCGQLQRGEAAFTKGAYYIGKMIWNKGYRELLHLLSKYEDQLDGLQVDLYGSGEDSDAIRQTAEKLRLLVKVHPGRDHADKLFHDYKVFINPSTTDVVCTTTAEALAMGKIVICANHPSNEFFKQFPNCRIYNDESEFVKLTLGTLSDEPAPMTDDLLRKLSWEAATERLIKAAKLNKEYPYKDTKPASLRSPKLKRRVEEASVYVHQCLSGVEVARQAFGATPKSLYPDEQQCKELGLAVPTRTHSRLSLKWD
ncbi:digalactosyldiacylglycerol synthase 2 [Carex littledalei]|uniref:Digalactosyldiacylglycerol synthase 2, chloroplastic n=1 Tax=Carex littledalei TaxID=544730 RepID=A0A833QR11_9POAL|nr:digalactosyldiacylglycerol synthase 2 [Carex littledalei]